MFESSAKVKYTVTDVSGKTSFRLSATENVCLTGEIFEEILNFDGWQLNLY